MPSPINTYADLVAAIAALPVPPAGTVRVYRGQTKDYGNLTPSGLRKMPRNQAIWFAYSGMLHASLQSELVDQAGGLSMEGFRALGLWFAAVAQHYGPGSDFLDVTHSLDAALWFALNKTTVVEATGAIGPPGPPDPARDHPTRAELVRYDPWHETGYLFVLDLPVWDGQDLPGPGVIVDLALAPPVFSSSPRMRAQAGCLVNCRNPDGSPFDVRALLVGGAPLEVRRPMSGAPGPVPMFDHRVADIYPSPAQDPWFARFLSVPMIYAPEPMPPALQRPIPVTVYHDPGNQRYLEEVHFYDVALRLPLLHRAIPDFSGDASGPQDLPRPVAITLEAPLIFPYPTADSDHWHQGLLGSDLPDACPWYAFGHDAPQGGLRLDNVLFEFSLLEEVGWERVVRDGATIRSLRGVWLRRAGEWLEAAFVHQTLPAGPLEQVGFLPLRHDADSGRILFVPANGNAPASLDTLGEYGKAVFMALMLLRHLSPRLKCEPTPIVVMGPSEGPDRQPLYQMTVGVAGAAARVYRVQAPSPNPDWYVLRDAQNPQEPFTQVSHREGALRLESRQPFRDFPIEDLAKNLPRPAAAR